MHRLNFLYNGSRRVIDMESISTVESMQFILASDPAVTDVQHDSVPDAAYITFTQSLAATEKIPDSLNPAKRVMITLEAAKYGVAMMENDIERSHEKLADAVEKKLTGTNHPEAIVHKLRIKEGHINEMRAAVVRLLNTGY